MKNRGGWRYAPEATLHDQRPRKRQKQGPRETVVLDGADDRVAGGVVSEIRSTHPETDGLKMCLIRIFSIFVIRGYV